MLEWHVGIVPIGHVFVLEGMRVLLLLLLLGMSFEAGLLRVRLLFLYVYVFWITCRRSSICRRRYGLGDGRRILNQ